MRTQPVTRDGGTSGVFATTLRHARPLRDTEGFLSETKAFGTQEEKQLSNHCFFRREPVETHINAIHAQRVKPSLVPQTLPLHATTMAGPFPYLVSRHRDFQREAGKASAAERQVCSTRLFKTTGTPQTHPSVSAADNKWRVDRQFNSCTTTSGTLAWRYSIISKESSLSRDGEFLTETTFPTLLFARCLKNWRDPFWAPSPNLKNCSGPKTDFELVP